MKEGTLEGAKANNIKLQTYAGKIDGDVESQVAAIETSMQFPLLMASMGIEAIRNWVDNGTKPVNSPGLDFFNTGVELVTDNPIEGIESIDSNNCASKCWGR